MSVKSYKAWLLTSLIWHSLQKLPSFKTEMFIKMAEKRCRTYPTAVGRPNCRFNRYKSNLAITDTDWGFAEYVHLKNEILGKITFNSLSAPTNENI